MPPVGWKNDWEENRYWYIPDNNMVACHIWGQKKGKSSCGLSPDGSSSAHPSSSDTWLSKISLVHYAVSLMLQELHLICHSAETRNSKLLVKRFLARSLVQMCYPAHAHLPWVSMACAIINHRKRVENSEFICEAAGGRPQWLPPRHSLHGHFALPQEEHVPIWNG